MTILATNGRHCNGTCLPRPVTVACIKHATAFLYEPYPGEDENYEGVYKRKKRKASV